MSHVQSVIVAEGDSEQRLDRWFKRRYPALTHGRLEKLLRTGQIRVDGKRAQASLRLAAGQAIRIPPGIDAPPPADGGRFVSDADAKLVQSLVLHVDDDVIALDKPPGLAVQGGSGTPRHLDGMLDALRLGGERPRLVHRLDRDTSGVLLLARSARSAARLAEAFRDKHTRKLYVALVAGVPKPERGKIELALAKTGEDHEIVAADDEGKRAATLYDTLDVMLGRAAVLVLQPLTGRTHQLRVHCATGLSTPVVGDAKYGGLAHGLGDGVAPGLHLHAASIALPHPSGRGVLAVAAPLPAHMRTTFAAFGFDPAVAADLPTLS
jgi:23S rRNA pseudouridine955/2504/2580 synthase